MTTSRRGFLRSLTGGAAASVAWGWPVSESSAAALFEPPRASQDPGLIRLNSNENAYGPTPKTLDAIRSAIGSVNRYPFKETNSLRERIASLHHVHPEQVLIGCGSTEILRMAACAFLGGGKQLLQASPTFEAIERYAQIAGAGIASVRLNSAFAHDVDAMLAKTTPSTTLVYICNPNNPTASLTPRKDLEHLIAKLPASAFVVIDEAYHHFAGRSDNYISFIERPLDDERVIVMRTFSKVYGLAGMRLGYAVGSAKAVQQMRKFASEANTNAIVVQAAAAALDDTEAIDKAVDRNADDRQEFFNQALGRMIKPIDSHANFVMMNVMHPAEQVIQDFARNNVLVGRRFPALDTYIRVTLGRPEEMLAFWHTWDTFPYSKDMMSH